MMHTYNALFCFATIWLDSYPSRKSQLQGSFWVWANQWVKVVLYNAFSQWPSPYQEWSLTISPMPMRHVCQLSENKAQESNDDVIKWKHFPRYWPFVRGIHRSPVNSPHKGKWRGTLMFSLIWAWMNAWVNNRGAGDWWFETPHTQQFAMADYHQNPPVSEPKGSTSASKSSTDRQTEGKINFEGSLNVVA